MIKCAFCKNVIITEIHKSSIRHFCGRDCYSNWQKGKKLYQISKTKYYKWRKLTKQGYVLTKNKFGRWVEEHRLIMEENLGRELFKNEIIHHLNGNPKDNRFENLRLCQSQSEHSGYHLRENPYRTLREDSVIYHKEDLELMKK